MFPSNKPLFPKATGPAKKSPGSKKPAPPRDANGKKPPPGKKIGGQDMMPFKRGGKC